MPASASEMERLEKSKRKAVRTRHAEEYRLEAVAHYRKAKEIDPKKTITDCAREVGANGKTPDDWVLEYEGSGRVTQARTEEQLEIDRIKKESERLRRENEFPKRPIPKLVGGGHAFGISGLLAWLASAWPGSPCFASAWPGSPCFASAWQESPRQRQSGGKKPH